MKLVSNSGTNRVVDELRGALVKTSTLDVASPDFSLFAFEELRDVLRGLSACRLVLPAAALAELRLLGGVEDRQFRNRLGARFLARQCAVWLQDTVQVRKAHGPLPQAALVAGHADVARHKALAGNCPLTTDGLGVTPGNQFSLIQASENDVEWQAYAAWFAGLWNALPASQDAKNELLARLDELIQPKPPSVIYFAMLLHMFRNFGGELDEDRVIRAATGIRNTVTWKKLFKFQRDGVIGAIDKLERFGGCIIADSVGLGKTFEALAIIKYYELRNDRVLVLCPKRLRDNWTLYKANDRRNVLAPDRLHYDVLNHTDLSRDGGMSGDIDLSYVNWGNYDLVVIDESHNFRNKAALKDRDTRYDRLMKHVIRAGVKTRVLMLSATPVNNRLSDLRNQIAFVTEGDDAALTEHGIPSIATTIRLAQAQFNRWSALSEAERRPARLLEMLGFDYFKLLDLLTIARSRKHVVKYYGTSETGKFPERLPPMNLRCDVDLGGSFPPIAEINDEIRHLNLSAYAPLRYVLPHKQAAYDAKYSTKVRGGAGFFRQSDREESLIHLLRVNMLKRMESSVTSFGQTVARQLADVEMLLGKLTEQASEMEELAIDDVDIDDPLYETLLAGRKIKVLLQDVDQIRWRQDLLEDHNRLATLHSVAQHVSVARDLKLAKLREVIAQKCAEPINAGNKKVIVFTAFADTAAYLYRELHSWAQHGLGLHSALVTGASGIKTTLKTVRLDLGSILTAFSPRSKERGAEFAEEGQIDLLIATDCISEGQNLQDCDYLINYDIHWNPVRIIQRFGRIDRIGSTNASIQLVNYWPDISLDEYINLKERVESRMMIADVTATGDDNVLSAQANDVSYRKEQLRRLQEEVIELEDLKTGVSITDMGLNDFRMDLLNYVKANGELNNMPSGMHAVVPANPETGLYPGVIFTLRNVNPNVNVSQHNRLHPYYLVYINREGEVIHDHTEVKRLLDLVRSCCKGQSQALPDACSLFNKETADGRKMQVYSNLLGKTIRSMIAVKEETDMDSLFRGMSPTALGGSFKGLDDFELIAFLVIQEVI